MEQVKILIVEDQVLVAENIREYLLGVGYAVAGPAASYKEAMDAVKQDMPDIVIMDIHLKGKKDGIEAAFDISKMTGIPVIFLTDLDDEKTIKRAGEIKGATYLLKPFAPRQVLVSIQHALNNTSTGKAGEAVVLEELRDDNYVLNDCLFIRHDHVFRKYKLDDILYLQADRAYSEIHMCNGEKHVQAFSMNKLLQRISRPSFMQVHRSYAVNLEKIDGIKGNMLLLGKPEKEIQIGESFKEDLMSRLPMV